MTTDMSTTCSRATVRRPPERARSQIQRTGALSLSFFVSSAPIPPVCLNKFLPWSVSGAGSDSDDSSYSVEMPPVVHAQDKTTADTRSVDDAAGYDEPEAIISDGERELPTTSWARERHSSLCDAHDYAEPDA